MSYFDSHLIFFIWTLISIFIHTVHPQCYYQTEQESVYTDWLCANITVSNENILTELIKLNKTVETLGLFRVSGEFDASVFLNYTSLRNIFILESNFKKIELKSTNLRKLKVYRSVLPKGTTFEKCKNLDKLSIKDVTGLSTDNNLFSGLRRLKSLDIKQQDITYINRNTFKGLYKLAKLSLVNNSIEYIHRDSFIDLIHLKELHIEDNNIIHINEGVFKPLTQLTSLRIYGKKLDPMPLEMFKNQIEITNIGLPLNTWKNFDIKKVPQVFPKLSFFSYQEDDSTSADEVAMRKMKKQLLTLLFDREKIDDI